MFATVFIQFDSKINFGQFINLYGFLQSVVSGKVDPDTYIIARTYKSKHLKILTKNKGEKSVSIQIQDAMKEVENTSDERDSFCLSDDQILELSEIGLLLEDVYGRASDIEWAVYQVLSILNYN